MLLKKGNFYIIEIDDSVQGYDAYGKKVNEYERFVVIFFNEPDMTTELNVREATELEKEYWIDSMQESDEINQNEFSGVGLELFEEWKKLKGK